MPGLWHILIEIQRLGLADDAKQRLAPGQMILPACREPVSIAGFAGGQFEIHHAEMQMIKIRRDVKIPPLHPVDA